ncbi:outer membrane protein [Rhizobium lusitanum]|uniref:Outer membrane immunogenic protein n=1 Tax=Rhizobium lusitanum TaxID=293958 RepID=A0A7X0IQ71_9HYPH|nr:outer membrane protein [Rhizobium lusitanum]MBB6483676.1 outer membrane immunogenic protein [Rhizobium lusitanum]
MKFLFASVAVIASTLAVSAHAADLATPTAPAAPAEAGFSWTGGYLGVNGGAGWLNGDFSVPGASTSDKFNGGFIGGFAGFNYQLSNNVVLGVEGDLNYNWNSNNYDFFGTKVKVGTDVAGSVRARVGYAFDRTLVYATGGWTATRGFVKALGDKETETFNGWTVGAGVDYAFTNNIFARAEYRFSSFGDKDFYGIKADLDQHVISVGVGVKF